MIESRSNNIPTVRAKNGGPRRGRGESAANDVVEERRIVFFIVLLF